MPTQPPIAIVGIGVLFPKSPDLATYWRNIVDAADCISEVPEGHSWSASDYYSADPNAKDKSWATRGGFIERVPFDPMAHGVPPNMLESIDTTQLLSLIVARECLKDAGMDPDGEGWNRDRTACIIGITGTQEMAITAGSRLQGPVWRKSLERCGITGELQDAIVDDIGNHFPTWTEQTFPGLLGNVVAGRIANRLDLGGTNCVVDAACASSLAAMQYAIGDLASGRSDVVLSGGADMLNDAFMFQCFTRTPAFTKNGDAKPFDASADGILIGEGIAIVAMKRLDDAERDGDRIYAVIKGLGSSSDGRGSSIYAPVSSGQAKALRRTYEMAGVDVDSIELVEAHGTGTKAGDVAEVAGLKAVYGDSERTDRWVTLGSVKSQVGHTKSTAGAAGLVKAVLALHHKVLPPTAKVDTPNPKMDFDNSPFFLSPRARPWIRAADHPRRAAVSAFGFGGSNFHALLEEHGPADTRPSWAAESELFLLGADSVEELRAELRAIETSEAPTLAHRARTVLERWTPGKKEVLGFVVDGDDDLPKKLQLAARTLDGTPIPGIHYGSANDKPTVAFLFPGQGSQYVEMGRTAALRHPALRAAFDAADEHFRNTDRPSLSSVVFPPPAFDDDCRATQESELRRTEWAQPAIGAASMGWLDVLAGFGVTPDLTAGHSYGELVALHAAGALDAEALLAASRLRGQRMADLADDLGTMAAVTGPLAEIESAIEGIEGVVLANRNHPGQGVISGTDEAVEAGVRACTAAGLEAKRISVGAAFHSPLVADAAAPFASDLQAIRISKPALPVWSTVSARPHGKTATSIRKALVDQITAPVDWVGVLEGLWDAGARVFVECGPKGVLSGLTRATLPDATVVSVDAKRHKVDGDTQLKDALAALAAAGLPIDLGPLLAERLPAAPRTPGSMATTWLGGANHKNPSTLEPPMPKLPKKPVEPVQPAPPPGLAGGWADVPTTGAAVSKPPALAKSTTEAAPTFTPGTQAPTTPSMPSGDLAALIESTRSTLQAFQAAQTRTAEVHGRFLDAWAESSRNFNALFEAHTQLVHQAIGQGVSVPTMPTQASYSAPVVPAMPVPPAVSSPLAPEIQVAAEREPPPEPGAMPVISSTTTSSALIPLLDAQMAVDAKSAPKTATPTPASTGPSRDTLVRATLTAVSEKTGYPMEMLELSMDLESDLGVDSIKRVEILGRVQEDVPGLPELDNERMGALRTLDEVVAYLEESLGGTAPPVAAAPAVGRQVLVDATLAAVSAKTGYPLEMLELSMDLESDLGVDSIKRVEILGAVSDAVPSLPELDNERMGALRTLEEVVAYLDEALGSSAPAPMVGSPVSGPSREELTQATLTAVAAKTGYPREMLELGMDLESDLGVDSIKRVEILGAVSESIPALPELDNERMGALRTLDEVVAYLVESVGAPTVPEFTNPIFEATRSVSREAIEGALLDSVATKTGYPREMLELSMDMESDLGVDSIKRVEIMGAVTEALPDLPELDNETLGALRTLGDVLDHIASVQAGLGFAHVGSHAVPADPSPLFWVPPAAPDSPAPVEVGLPPIQSAASFVEHRPVTLRRRVVRAVPAPTGVPAPLLGPVAITVDPNGRAAALASVLRDRGLEVHLVDPDWNTGAIEVPPCRSAIHLAAAGSDDPARVRGAFLFAKAVGPEVDLFATVSVLGGRFGQSHATGPWVQGGLAGLPKTLSHEWDATRVLALDIAEEVAIEAVADALSADRGVIEVGLTPNPVVLRTVSQSLPSDGGSPALTESDLVVVSGGARGVTAAVVIELARRTRARFLLLGRSEVPEADPAWASGVDDARLQAAWIADCKARGAKPVPKAMNADLKRVRAAREVRTNLEAIRALGSQVAYAPVDIRNADAVAEVVETHGPATAVIHGAGVLADKLIMDKTPEAFDQVWSTKIDGWNALTSAMDLENLKFAAVFSSVAGRFGNIGQCDYSMANEGLTHAALRLQQQGIRAVAFDWGPWDGGMVTPELKRSFAARGLTAIPLDLGANALCDELERGTEVEVVIEGPRPDEGRVRRTFGLAGDPWLADHSIDNSPVVPVAVVLEWVAQTAREVFPGLEVVAIRDLAVLKGLVLDGGIKGVTLEWRPAAPRDGGMALAFELLGDKGPLGVPAVHYRAVVDLAEQRPQAQPFPGSNGLGKNRYDHDLSAAYDNFLFHGPAFQGIDSIVGISDHGMVGWLKSGGEQALGRGGSWQTDPVAIDSALQMMLLWVREVTGLGALPSMVKEYRQYRDFPERLACHLEVAKLSERRGRFTATLVDEQDNVVAVLGDGEYTADPALNTAFQNR